MLILKYQLTQEDFFDFNCFALWSDPLKKDARSKYYLKTWLYSYIIFLIPFSLFNTKRYNIGTVKELSIFLLIALIGVLLFGSMLAKSSIRKLVDNLLKDPRNENLLLPSEIHLN